MNTVETGARLFENRRTRRVPVSLPVQLKEQGGEDGGAVSPLAARSKDVSAGGMFVTTSGGGSFVPGDIVRVILVVPWESRSRLPFSRIVGLCRVVRVERRREPEEKEQGLALSFFEGRVEMLATMYT